MNQNQIVTQIKNKIIYKNQINNLPKNEKLIPLAKALRKAGNYPEVVFWQQAYKNKLHKIDFDRQRIIGNYIVDF